jgi:uncharacterized protein YcgI (DUF1989 family)
MARRVVDEFVIPNSTGKAFIVKKGQVLRIIELGGRQVADVYFLNAHNYKEQFAARHTVLLESLEAMAGIPDRESRMRKIKHLYSKAPWENVMLTVIDDTIGDHVFGSHCSRKCYEFMLNDPNHRSCSDNFSECLNEYGIALEDLDSAGVFNVFMKEVIDENGNLHIKESPAQDGDYIDLLAEMDVLVAFSACPAPPPTNDEVPKDMKVQILE